MSFVHGIVGEGSTVTVTRIKGNDFEVHFTYDYQGALLVQVMGTEESKEDFVELCVDMVQAVEEPIPSWFSTMYEVDVTCKVYVDITDSTLAEVAEMNHSPVCFTVDSDGIVRNSSGEIIEF